MSTPIEVLCRGFPTEFTMYINSVRGLGFEEKPDYVYLQALFEILLRTLKPSNDFKMPSKVTCDWVDVLRSKGTSCLVGYGGQYPPNFMLFAKRLLGDVEN